MIFGVSIVEYLFDKHLTETITVFGLVVASTKWLIEKTLTYLHSRKTNEKFFELVLTASKYYVVPDAIFDDPSHYHEPGETTSKRTCIIDLLEKSFKRGAKEKRIVVLGDAGIGKSALLLNLYKRRIYRLFCRYKVEYISLGEPSSFDKISELKDKENTVLLLDALDENVEAIRDYKGTVKRIYSLAEECYRVVITCRTQFFVKNAELPEITNYRSGAISAGDEETGKFVKVYIAPLTPEQVLRILAKKYLFNIRRFPLYNFDKSIEMVSKTPSLAVRPMLISFLDYLLQDKVVFSYSYEIYEAMIRSWLRRKKSDELEPEYNDNLRFVYLLGRNIARHMSQRGGYHITSEELRSFAKEHQVNIPDWQIDGRSLLNVDALGNYKFAHLSILEVLLARAIYSNEDLGDWKETDQAKQFKQEMQINETLADKIDGKEIENKRLAKKLKYLIKADLRDLDLSDKDFSWLDMRKANLTKSKMHEVNFSDSNITEANLEFTDLFGSVFTDANLSKAMMKGALLSHARFENANLQGAELIGADLSHSQFVNCNLTNARLLGADLTDTSFTKCIMEGADLCGIRIQSNDDRAVVKINLLDTAMTNAIVPSNFEEYVTGDIIGMIVHDKEPVHIYCKTDVIYQDIEILKRNT